jgi:hypothetical protein
MRKLELITETTTGGGGVTTTYNQMNLESGSTSTVTNTLIPGDGTTAWTNQLGDVTTSLGKVVRTNDSPLAWGQMASFGSLPANTDGYLEFVGAYKSGRSSGGYFMGGFSLTPGGSDWNDIEYKWYYEGPQNRISVAYPSTTRNNAATNYSITDVLKIERTIVGGVGTVKFYRNGVLLGTTTGATLGNLDTGGTRINLRIFSRDGSSGVIGGKVANFRTYNIALTAAQVLQNFNAQKSRFGL